MFETSKQRVATNSIAFRKADLTKSPNTTDSVTMAATNSSAQLHPNTRVETTPGAYPSTPSLAESLSPVFVTSQSSLAQAVHERRAEYTRPHTTIIKVGSWNVASLSGTENDIGDWFVDGKGVSETLSGLSIGKEDSGSANKGQSSATVESVDAQESRRIKKKSTLPKHDPGYLPGGEEIGLYVLGLQEIVDVSSTAEAIRPYSDPNPSKRWKKAVAEALPKGYSLVADQQLIGLYLLIYASPTIAPTISSVSTTSVGTGLMGYMGNKGAVTARLVLGETTRLVFVNCHLSAGVEAGNLDRRNWDASQILSRTKFDPVESVAGVREEFSEGIGDEDFGFWFGDLNYRLENIPGEDVRRLLMLHTRDEYGKNVVSKRKIEHELANPESLTFASHQEAATRTSEEGRSSIRPTGPESSHHSMATSATLLDADKLDPSADPTSLQTTISSLLPHDQLHSQIRLGKAFHDGWREGSITFLPTYKYDVGSVGMFDTSEKQRGPSWCDRILYRTRKDKLDYEERVRVKEQASYKDNELRLRGVVEEAASEAALFDYDPDTDGADNEPLDTTAAYGTTVDDETFTSKAGFRDRIHLDHYTSYQRVLSSDHKPLNAIFTIDYDAVVPELKAKVHSEVARDLDKAENENRPHVTVVVDQHHDSNYYNSASQDHEGVDFGDVKYDHSKSRFVTIANTGRVPATVGFVVHSTNAGQVNGICPPWLQIRFDRPSNSRGSNTSAQQEYTLEPGDAANVELIIHITDPDLVRRLSDGAENLEDVLVLRVHNGRDYFLPLHGNWQQSAFGRSIEKLIRIPEGGVRRWQQQRPGGSSHADHDVVKWSVPKELFRLTESIEELVTRSLAEWGMRGETGIPPWESDDVTAWPFEAFVSEDESRGYLKWWIREAIDLDLPFNDMLPPEAGAVQRLEAMSETLVQFLTVMENGIVPEHYFVELDSWLSRSKFPLDEETERSWIMEILSQTSHGISFTIVTMMLNRTANELVPVAFIDKYPQNRGKLTPMELCQEAQEDPADAQRTLLDQAFARIFAGAMIRMPGGMGRRVRERAEGKRRRIIEVFLLARGVGGLCL